MNNIFYNTIGEIGEILERSKIAVNGQNLLILKYFLSYPIGIFTPFEIQEKVLELRSAPVTSIRRGMTNLTNDGFLIKTDIQRKGRYGKANHCWKLNAEKCSAPNNRKKATQLKLV